VTTRLSASRTALRARYGKGRSQGVRHGSTVLKAGLERRVEKLESQIDTSDEGRIKRIFEHVESIAPIVLLQEYVIRCIIRDPNAADPIDRLRRYCAGADVEVLTDATLARLGCDPRAQRERRVWRNSEEAAEELKRLRESLPRPDTWEYELRDESWQHGNQSDTDRLHKSALPLLRYAEAKYLAGETESSRSSSSTLNGPSQDPNSTGEGDS